MSGKKSLNEVIERSLAVLQSRVDEFISIIQTTVPTNFPPYDAYVNARLALELTLQKELNADFLIDIAKNYYSATLDLVEGFWNDRGFDYTQDRTLHSNDKTIHRADTIRKIIIKIVEGYRDNINELAAVRSGASSLTKELQTLARSIESQGRGITALEERIESAGRAIQTQYGPLQRKYDEITQRFSDDIVFLDQKRKEIEALSSVVTGKAIVSRYSKSAALEGRSANRLRLSALGFMTAACIVAGISFYEATSSFELDASIFRILFALFLSVPAAYLARESAKHRKQQYEHLQVALDVHAINPYIASLPLEAQHELKKEMAERIFVSKNFDHVIKEVFPMNVQEIFIAGLEILKSKKEDNQSKEKDTKSN